MNSLLNKKNLLQQFNKQQKKHFSVLPKVPKMELNMRTPYRVFFENFNGFSRIYVGTIKGQLSIQNRTIPVIYLLPAGEVKLTQLVKGEGSKVKPDCSGEFIHSGGYAIYHDNNTCDINLLECCEKENFQFEKVETVTEETDSKYDKEAQNYAVRKVLRRK